MLTPLQEKALGLNHHICVTANAGSGKTRVLVERYIRIVAGGHASVGEVVAITFTEKAASELRRKIAEGIALRIQAATASDERRRLEAVRSQLSSAFISTIHGFCARILREYPVEASIDAAFIVLEGIDQVLLLRECMRETFHAVLTKNDDPRLKATLLDVLRVIGRESVENILQELVYKRELMDRLTGRDGLYNQADDEILRRWYDAITGGIGGILEDSKLARDLETIVRAASGKKASDVRLLFESFRAAGALESRARAFVSMTSEMFTKDWKLQRAFIGRGSADAERESAIVGEIRHVSVSARTITPRIDFLLAEHPPLEHTRLLMATRCMLDLYQRTIERYEDRKLESGQLDFDDLQLRMRDLLRTESVRTRLANCFKYIMVDEYQDTNLLQYEIILPLLDRLTSGNLFIVGDPKQSIYGFRDADVTVFNRTAHDIEMAGGERVVMGESFRPLKDLVAFTNLLFSSLIDGGKTDGRTNHGPEDEIRYDALVQSRQNEASGSVELLIRRKSEEQDHDIPEGDLIARKILRLRENQAPVLDKDERGHPVQFRDIAILLRSRTNLSDIENGLEKNGVPFVVTAGVGYYQTQDILDFYNYFRFLLNPEDDIALVGILRSPLFCVSDAELYEVAPSDRSVSLWQHLKGTASHSDPLQRAVAMLTDDLTVGLRLSVSELISRITRQTSYTAIIAGLPRGDQCLANLLKLRRLARAFESRGLTNLYDFVARLKQLIEEAEQEGQGEINIQRDAVQIMTVHAAKGLEFPVVIIPSLDREFQREDEPFLSRTLGIGFKMGAVGVDEREKELAPVVVALKQEVKIKSTAEEKRVLYVACTRARDHLILSGEYDPAATRPSWMRWISEVLDLESGMNASVIAKSVPLESLRSEGGRFERISTIHNLRIAVSGPAQLASIATATVQPSKEAVSGLNANIQPIVRRPQGEVFSTTGIKTYRQCPARYYLQYVLGLPDIYARGNRKETETQEKGVEYSPEKYGTVLHSVMEHIGGSGQDSSAIRRLIRQEAEKEGLAGETEENLFQTVKRISESDLWSEVCRGIEARKEFSITAAFGSDYLTGTIDRLYKDASGVWNVLDFKTDRIDRQNLDQRGLEHEPQLSLYALLVARFHGVGLVRGTLLFTEHTDAPFNRTYGSSQLRTIEDELSKTIQSIQSGSFHPISTTCSVCPLFPAGCKPLFEN